MPKSATTMKAAETGTTALAGVKDPLAEFLVYLHVILPLGAIHTVTIRRHYDPARKDAWLISPGHFHVRRGDLIYWSMGDNEAQIEFSDPAIIGVPTLSVPRHGTSMGTVQSEAPLGAQIYKVVLETGSAVPDDGGDPTIIIDD